MNLGTKLKDAGDRAPPLVIALMIVFVAIGSTTAVAITLTSVEPTKVSMFGSSVEDSDFTLESMDGDVRGKSGQLQADVTLRNTANTTANASVLIQSVDSTGTVIAEKELSTGAVAGGDLWTTQTTLEANGLSEKHSELVVTVNQ